MSAIALLDQSPPRTASQTHSLAATAQALVAPGKGILAADESTGTIEKRFAAVHVPSTDETRRTYREMLFTTRELERYISGVILFDETIRQKSAAGTPIVDLLKSKGIIPGIKVDKGAIPMPFSPGEKITEGLDGLRARLLEYRALGAQFAKWRAILAIGEDIPTAVCLEDNANALARYAALCQEAGLVPIVEPEVLMDGPHPIERCEEATSAALHAVFNALYKHGISFEGMLLKPNMVLPGKSAPRQNSPREIAIATLRCLKRTVPASVPGIVFLSGGQSDITATENLNALNVEDSAPWELSFSYGRALQHPALTAWSGQPANAARAQESLRHRAWCNHKARFGEYDRSMETPA